MTHRWATAAATHAFRRDLLPRTRPAFTLLVLALLAAATALAPAGLVAPAGADPGAVRRTPPSPDACQSLGVPEGHRPAFRVYARGVQIYRWDGAGWVFVAPEATLYADAGGRGAVGIHYGGPTWESASGSVVVGRVLARCTPDPGAIPWLLLEAAYREGPGIFRGVTFIQRVNTRGGLAPTDPGDFPGDEARVPYDCAYVFYRAHR